jgi:lamin tail-like protein
MRAGRFMTSYVLIASASLVPLALTVACGGVSVAPTQPTITAAPALSVPTIAAAPTDVMATANALRTQIAPTLNAAATQFAPTMVAVQTQTVPTLEAIGTEVVPTVNAAATTTAESAIRITDAQLTSSAPTLTVANVGDRTIDLSAWSLQVGDQPVKLPPNTELAPGKSLVLHGSAGTSDSDNIYLGSSLGDALNALQPGAQVVLENPSGSLVASFTVPSAQ